MCDGADMKKLIDVNCGTPTVMMSIVLPKMLRKRRGVIVNFGSFVGEANCPYPTVYPSTKSFCHKLTRDLQVRSAEGKRCRVDVIQTNFI